MIDLIITSFGLLVIPAILGSNKIYSSNGQPGFIILHLNMKMLEGGEVRHFYKSNIQEWSIQYTALLTPTSSLYSLVFG